MTNYLARTHAADTSPEGRSKHSRHLAAVEHVQGLLAAEEAKRAQGPAYAPAPREAIELQIRQAQENPSFGDTRHKDHAAQVEYVGALYRQLHPK